jgi:hypothetical protein
MPWPTAIFLSVRPVGTTSSVATGRLMVSIDCLPRERRQAARLCQNLPAPLVGSVGVTLEVVVGLHLTAAAETVATEARINVKETMLVEEVCGLWVVV